MELPTAPPLIRSRNISYRKPAPVYIPSPPPSPQTPSTSALSLSPADVQLYQSESIPPLPTDWKRRVQRARGLETATTLPDVGQDEKINNPRLSAGDASIPQLPQASQGSSGELPHWQTYRPPTPPKRKLADEDTALQPFPDRLEPLRYVPALHAERATHIPTQPLLNSRPSFRSERSETSSFTLVAPAGSHCCGIVRSVQPEPDEPPSEQQHNLPVLPRHRRDFEKPLPEPIDTFGSLVKKSILQFLDVLKHALCDCFVVTK